MNIVANSRFKVVDLAPAPKQTKILGARVAGIGVVTAVAAELPWCFALITDADGNEHHAFLADLKKDNVTFPDEPQPYREVRRRVGYGLWNDMLELESVPFSDLTHTLDREELALPGLTTLPCPECGGEGYHQHPDPLLSERCTTCYGAQVVEVCSGCLEVPDIRGGAEVCGCSRIQPVVRVYSIQEAA